VNLHPTVEYEVGGAWNLINPERLLFVALFPTHFFLFQFPIFTISPEAESLSPQRIPEGSP
jgi:hypothetical protein